MMPGGGQPGATCLVCGSPMSFFFSKRFRLRGLDTAEYWRCSACGFVASRTHLEMAPEEWDTLNREWHEAYQGTESDPSDPKWRARLESQARAIGDLQRIGLLNEEGRWLDYGCGDGKLSNLLRTRYGLSLAGHERYMRKRDGYLEESGLLPGSFDFVVTTSVFEHLARREQFDSVDALVSKNGVLGTHTLVCEDVPCDPSWFYLLPVHCTFHTNRSMDALFRQWGYRCSVYSVDAKLWFWFKSGLREVESAIERANRRAAPPAYVFKRGFVDYWKCAPHRAA